MKPLRLELGPEANKGVHKLILPDGRDIMSDLAPTQIDISIKAGNWTKMVIHTDLARNIVAEIMPEHVLVVTAEAEPERKPDGEQTPGP